MNSSENPGVDPSDDLEPENRQAPEELDGADEELIDHDIEEELDDDEEYDDDDDDEDDDEDDDDEEYDDEEYDDDEDEGKPRKKRRKSRVKMHCFNCNRPEGFFLKNKGRWMHSYLVGFTFGLMNLIGPFKCQCCGATRYMRGDKLHPKRWIAPKTPVSPAD